MSNIGNITLSREKTTVAPQAILPDGHTLEPYFAIKSNRTTFTLESPPITDHVVVRGHNLPGTIRMTGLLINAFNQDKTALRRPDGPDWRRLWVRNQSDYETTYAAESWVSVHVNGRPFFSTQKDTRVDVLERAAHGGEINDKVVRQASLDIIGEAARVAVEHDSQTALVLTEGEDFMRCAILERSSGGNHSLTATMPLKDGPPPTGPFLFFTASLIEAINLSVFVDHVRQLVAQNLHPDTSPQRLRDAMKRRKELIEDILSFETKMHVSFRPDEPAFLEDVA